MLAILPANTYALKKKGLLWQSQDGFRVGIFGTRGGDFAPLTRYGDTRSHEQISAALDKEANELAASMADLELRCATAGLQPDITICLFHYPPTPPGRTASRFTEQMAKLAPQWCLYGHLHGELDAAERSVRESAGIQYRCVSCDQIDFAPVLIFDSQAATN